MTAEEIVREIYGNDYTIDDLKHIEKAVVDEQGHWRKKGLKKMYVIKNLANDKYYQKLEEHNHKLDAEREEATTFNSQERSISKASILHAELSTLGLGINFKVEEL